MPEREWTGSVANLPEGVRAQAIELANRANGDVAQPYPGGVSSLLSDLACTLSEWADAIEQLYVRRDAQGASFDHGSITNAQALAIGRLAFQHIGAQVQVTNSAFDLAPGWVYVSVREFSGGRRWGYGVEPDGSVNS